MICCREYGTVERGLDLKQKEDTRVLYSSVSDAGSTGTRLHVFAFQVRVETKTHTILDETLLYESLKKVTPGLSSFADRVDQVFLLLE